MAVGRGTSGWGGETLPCILPRASPEHSAFLALEEPPYSVFVLPSLCCLSYLHANLPPSTGLTNPWNPLSAAVLIIARLLLHLDSSLALPSIPPPHLDGRLEELCLQVSEAGREGASSYKSFSPESAFLGLQGAWLDSQVSLFRDGDGRGPSFLSFSSRGRLCF